MKTNPRSANLNLAAYTPRIFAISLLAILLLLTLTGCQNNTRPSAAVSPAEIYILVSVDGKSVPCSVTHQGTTLTVKSGAFTRNADGTCLSQSTFCVPPHPDVHREVKATYTQQGAELTMRWQGAGITKGQIHGDTFTMNNEGMIFRYQK